MSKAERRKRARQRQKDRVQSAGGVEGRTEGRAEGRAEGVPEAGAQEAAVQEAAVAEAQQPAPSGYITGPIAPAPAQRQKPSPSLAYGKFAMPVPPVGVRQQAAPLELPSSFIEQAFEEPSDGEDEEEAADDEDEEEAADDEDDTDEDDDTDDDDEETEDGAEDDDEPTDEEEALFNLACAALEQGASLSWNEVVTWLCSAEVEDPRLALLVALLVEQDPGGQPVPLSGARVLSVLVDMQLGDIVEEAREVVTLSPKESGDSPEERAVVLSNARQLSEQAKHELGSPSQPASKAKAKPARPLKASEVKNRQSALGTVVSAVPVRGEG